MPKPDGRPRYCNDFLGVNDISVFDAYLMPRVDKLIDRLGKARYISTLDLTKGYWQPPPGRRRRLTPDGLYQYRVLLFGLHRDPPTFQ